MEIINYRKIEQGFLVASFDVIIPNWGNIIFKKCKLFNKNGHRWVSFPSNKFEKDGKTLYTPNVAFQEKQTHKKFEIKLIELIDKGMYKEYLTPPEEQDLFI